MSWLQDLADAYREQKAARHQDVARRHLLRRDFWRWEIEKPWQRLVPRAVLYVALAVGAGLLAWRLVP